LPILPGCGVTSFRLDTGQMDHPAPFVGFFRDELAEIGRRAAKHRTIQIGKLRLELGIDQRGVNLLVEPIDNFGRSVPGRAKTED